MIKLCRRAIGPPLLLLLLLPLLGDGRFSSSCCDGPLRWAVAGVEVAVAVAVAAPEFPRGNRNLLSCDGVCDFIADGEGGSSLLPRGGRSVDDRLAGPLSAVVVGVVFVAMRDTLGVVCDCDIEKKRQIRF